MMHYSLTGKLVISGGHDEDKVYKVEEYFDAEDLKTAVLIAKAMVQSQKIRNERYGHRVDELDAVLTDDTNRICWKTCLVPEEWEGRIVAPEHFADEIIASIE